LLGEAGYKVLLVDRAAFPSDTLSTHFFRGARMVDVLQRIHVLDQVMEIGSPPLRYGYWYFQGAKHPFRKMEEETVLGEIGYNLSVRRDPLDHLLVRRAAALPSVRFLERTNAAELLAENGRVTGARLVTPDGEETVSARIVIGADGRHSSVARFVKAPNEEAHPPYRGVYYCYVRNFPGPGGKEPDGIEVSILDDEIAYVFPSDDQVACIALSLNLADYAWAHKQAKERFSERIAHHKGFAERFAAATWISRLYGCGPEPNYVRMPYGPGWALVGDAGWHQDPWSGHGMDNASVHATYLADALIDWWKNNVPETEALATYRQRRNAQSLENYRITIQIAQDARRLLPDQQG
jgi:flavin-dependent dehydrogenase